MLANDTDASTVQSTSDPDNGTAAITASGTSVTYTPDANYCNDPGAALEDTFTYTVNGGSTAGVSVTVTCADDPLPPVSAPSPPASAPAVAAPTGERAAAQKKCKRKRKKLALGEKAVQEVRAGRAEAADLTRG